MQFSSLNEIHSGETPQTSPVFGREDEMEKNLADGYGFKMSDWEAFERFLICGTEGGTYYVNERELTVKMAEKTRNVIKNDGVNLVNKLVEISNEGRAASNDQAIFILAMATTYGNVETNTRALQAIPEIIRTGTHMLHFAAFISGTEMRGWGTGLRKAISKWYLNRPIDSMIFQMLKYRSRDGWSQRDVLRLIHPRPNDEERSNVFWFVCNHLLKADDDFGRKVLEGDDKNRFRKFNRFVVPNNVPERILEYIRFQIEEDEEEIVRMLNETDWISHEMVRTQHKKSPSVNKALLEKMPLTATIRNLRNMTKIGVLKPLSDLTAKIVERIEDQNIINRQRIHPFLVLKAIAAYNMEDYHYSSYYKTSDFKPIPEICSALENAYMKSFKNVPEIDKRVYIAVDISGSMTSPINRVHDFGNRTEITCAMSAACLAQVVARAAKRHYIGAFEDRMIEVPLIKKNDSLSTTMKNMGEWLGGMTDIAQPMLDAINKDLEVDAFIILTDGQHYAGGIHPYQALVKYRKKSGINAKMVNVIMNSSWKANLSDPKDEGMLDIAGMDASVPQIIHEFLVK